MFNSLCCCFLFLILGSLPTLAQSDSADPFAIRKIVVEGAQDIDEGLLINASGLYEGQKVKDVGLIIGQATRNLWRLDLFETVSIERGEDKTGQIKIRVLVAPRVSQLVFEGISRKREQQLRDQLKVVKGSRLTPKFRKKLKNKIQAYFSSKGYEDSKVDLRWDQGKKEILPVYISISSGDQPKVKRIALKGGEQLSKKEINQSLRPLKRKLGLFKARYSKASMDEIEQTLYEKYAASGYVDFKVLDKGISKDGRGDLSIVLKLEEGEQYFIRKVQWSGNHRYTKEQLESLTGIREGILYNAEKLEEKLRYDPHGLDVSSLYLDQGYLFFNLDYRIVALDDHQVDIAINIREGDKAVIRKVGVVGNTITKEPVILRSISTSPGDTFSRSALIRSQSELATLGYFNPNTINVKPVPHVHDGTVDLIYEVEEQPDDKYQLTGTLNGPSGFAGGVGLVLNNFSSKDLFKFRKWKTLPRGDGEKLSLQYNSSGKRFNSFSFGYTNPWLDNRKNQSFFINTNYSRIFETQENGEDGQLNIIGGSIGLSKPLNWPDNYFSWTRSISLNRYSFNNYLNSLGIDEGAINLITLNNTLARNSVNHPFFPTTGSNLLISLSITPPYSLFREPEEEDTFQLGEYFKLLFDLSKYKKVSGKLTLKGGYHFGLISNYNGRAPLGPFERFHLGGTGMTRRDIFRGNDLIGLRGYPGESLVPVDDDTGFQGGVIYQKVNLELRYPVHLGADYSAYLYGFAEAGNTFRRVSQFNPLKLYKSAGVGMRFQLPFVGQFGVDWAYGFDTLPGRSNPAGGRFQFTLGVPIR